MSEQNNIFHHTEYKEWLTLLKNKVKQTQLKTMVTANQQLLMFYWELGLDIVKNTIEHGWSRSVLTHQIESNLWQREGDAPTIGLLLCKNHDKVVVEYALSDVHKPIGISEYQITKSLPEKFKSSLPTVEEIEAELNDSIRNNK